MGNNCVTGYIFRYSDMSKFNISTFMSLTEEQHQSIRLCSTSEFIIHWSILVFCCCLLALIIGVCYSYYRFVGGQMIFQYKVYSEKDEEENLIV
jgi:hypothetical protein